MRYEIANAILPNAISYSASNSLICASNITLDLNCAASDDTVKNWQTIPTSTKVQSFSVDGTKICFISPSQEMWCQSDCHLSNPNPHWIKRSTNNIHFTQLEIANGYTGGIDTNGHLLLYNLKTKQWDNLSQNYKIYDKISRFSIYNKNTFCVLIYQDIKCITRCFYKGVLLTIPVIQSTKEFIIQIQVIDEGIFGLQKDGKLVKWDAYDGAWMDLHLEQENQEYLLDQFYLIKIDDEKYKVFGVEKPKTRQYFQ
eukprot:NODE_985_length_2788_cov_1.010413.p1 type:complete len:255 gc:universal NODE_985_length_2788_cov_1.010413:1150-386(-)